jgi:hypothetical protein
MITVSRPINGISVNGDEWLLDESGKLLSFATVREAIQFFSDHNCTITDLLGLDFHFSFTEATEDGKKKQRKGFIGAVADKDAGIFRQA